jgi:hypothetical protein
LRSTQYRRRFGSRTLKEIVMTWILSLTALSYAACVGALVRWELTQVGTALLRLPLNLPGWV